ncbi:Fic family protein [Subtercola frigoramans]|uniref:Fic family protein n=1 Tax=Subtercola frigoramans TaxID=120298 RepID=A0ABS2L7U2_9MICO|nr:Fic family protein [Subtercola frigoramans]MBM7473158.1 Fic family protein [Subtercola frigoramans]
MSTDSPQPSITIPRAATEAHLWRPQARDLFSNAEVARQTGPYESTIPARIAAWSPELSAADVANVLEASQALSSFDHYALSRLGRENPALAPMSAILLRTESASSSQIEQLTTSARQLALAEIDEGNTANAGTVIGNVRAMEAALRFSDSLDQTSILAMHHELLSRQTGLEHEAGRLRTQLVWIGNRDTAGPRGAEFIAPQHELIPDAIADLIDFMRRDDVPTLVQIAVAHAQFETIHPFIDGNGRTGRALAQALLRNKGLATQVTVPISAGLLTDTERYFSALTAYRGGDAAPIVRHFADASRYAAVTGLKLVDDLYDQVEKSREKLRGLRPQSAGWQILPRLIGQPVVNTRYLGAALGLNDVTAVRALTALTDRGVLRERTGQARNRVWQHDGILDVLDAYAASIHRP